MRRRHARPSFLLRLPAGLREQPGWVFIGLMIALVGLGYATGFTESAIVRAVGETGMRVWGWSLLISGGLVVVGTIRAGVALEKLALRVLTCNMIVYGGWLLSITSARKAAMTLGLALLLAVTAELRVLQLRALIKRADSWVSDD